MFGIPKPWLVDGHSLLAGSSADPKSFFFGRTGRGGRFLSGEPGSFALAALLAPPLSSPFLFQRWPVTWIIIQK